MNGRALVMAIVTFVVVWFVVVVALGGAMGVIEISILTVLAALLAVLVYRKSSRRA